MKVKIRQIDDYQFIARVAPAESGFVLDLYVFRARQLPPGDAQWFPVEQTFPSAAEAESFGIALAANIITRSVGRLDV